MFINVFNEKETPGFYQQLCTRYARDFQWYQRQWKTDGKKEHCDIPKKIKVTFEIGLPVNKTQFSKTAITKSNTFFHKLIILININGNWHRQNRCVL